MTDARDRLTESDLEQIEALAHKDSAENFRGPLLALCEVKPKPTGAKYRNLITRSGVSERRR